MSGALSFSLRTLSQSYFGGRYAHCAHCAHCALHDPSKGLRSGGISSAFGTPSTEAMRIWSLRLSSA